MRIFKTILISSMAFYSLNALALDIGLTANSLKLRVYKFAVSTSPLCTNLQTIVDNGTSPSEINFMGGSNLGSGTIANGTYPCVVIEFDSVIHFTPSTNSTSGHCSTATENSLDVCSTGDSSQLIDGTSSSCVSGSDHVAMYLSTAAAVGNSSDGFHPPTSIGDTVHGFHLSGSLTISGGTSSGRFVVNPAGKVCDSAAGASCDGGGGTGTSCQLEPPAFSFTGSSGT